MQCIQALHTIEELIKKSRFIGIILPCADEISALRFIHNLHHEHPHASHIVYAYRILTPDGLVCRFHDAGEPSGTAGKPIFQHLEGKDLINVAVIVIRYFGGIKLGAGGLTRAYSNTASAVIEQAEPVAYIVQVKLRLTLDYQQLQECEYHLKKHGANILEQDFAEQVRLCISVPQPEVAVLLSKLRLNSCEEEMIA